MDPGPPRRLALLAVDLGTIPWRRLLVDLVVVVGWVAAVSLLFRVTGWSRWVYYVVVFAGVVGYTLATGPAVVRAGS